MHLDSHGIHKWKAKYPNAHLDGSISHYTVVGHRNRVDEHCDNIGFLIQILQLGVCLVVLLMVDMWQYCVYAV